MKIYIIGPTGSGKTTLARKLSKKLKIRNYELDLLVYDDQSGHVKRSDLETARLFKNILKKKSWIIEDVGRSKFVKGREQADIIYYIKIKRSRVYINIIARWIKQRLGILDYNYLPTFKNLLDMFKCSNSYFKKEDSKLKELSIYKNKIEYIDFNKLNELEIKKD